MLTPSRWPLPGYHLADLSWTLRQNNVQFQVSVQGTSLKGWGLAGWLRVKSWTSSIDGKQVSFEMAAEPMRPRELGRWASNLDARRIVSEVAGPSRGGLRGLRPGLQRASTPIYPGQRVVLNRHNTEDGWVRPSSKSCSLVRMLDLRIHRVFLLSNTP